MSTVGIDIGGRMHVVARCREGQARADRAILRVGQTRAGFGALDAWLDGQADPVTLVTMESSGPTGCRSPRTSGRGLSWWRW